MALADLEKIDDKLTKIYENQITTNAVNTTQTSWVDRSQVLLDQMNFIAFNNKSFINYKK